MKAARVKGRKVLAGGLRLERLPGTCFGGLEEWVEELDLSENRCHTALSVIVTGVHDRSCCPGND